MEAANESDDCQTCYIFVHVIRGFQMKQPFHFKTMYWKLHIILLFFLVFIVIAENEENNLSKKDKYIRNASNEIKKIKDAKKIRRKNRKKKNQRKTKGKKNGEIISMKGKRKNKNKLKMTLKKNQKNNVAKKEKHMESVTMQRNATSKDCVKTIGIVMKRWKDDVTNFEKQIRRFKKFSSTIKKKHSKKNIFDSVALKLVDIGGSNKSLLNCAGFDNSHGAKQLRNLTDILFNCDKKIDNFCNNENHPNPLLHQDVKICQNATTAFKKVAERCFEISMTADSTDSACSCWTGEEMLALSETVKSCKFKAVLDNQQRLKSCTSAFSKCRRAEDEAVTSIYICSQDIGEVTEDIDVLMKNLNALTEAKAKVIKVTQSSRRTSNSECPEFVGLVDQCK